MLETLDHTIRIGNTPTFLYFDLYLYSAYAAHYVYYDLDMFDQALMHFRTSTVYNNVTMVNYISFGSQLHVEFNAVKIKSIPLNQK